MKYWKAYSITVLLLSTGWMQSQSLGKITGKVSDQFGTLPGARVVVEGTGIATTTDVNGDYSIDIEEGEYVVTAGFVMYTENSKTVLVVDGETARVDFLLKTGFSIDQNVSLGSRAKPNSLLKNTAAVDIVPPQQITSSGQLELSHILQYLIPSFHSTNQTISDGTDHIDPATLRGLGPDQLLVLVNGKRRHSSSLLNVNGTVGRGSVGTDFNAIPISSIERIEILRDGAASQYGSDAIAGVINVILKKQIDAIQVESRTGTTNDGGGTTLFAGTNFGLKVGENGFINLTAEYRQRGSVNRAGDFTGPIYSNDPVEDQRLIAENNFFSQTGYSGRRIMNIGSAETQNVALMFNGELPLSENATFYMHGGRNYREGKANGFYRRPIQTDRVVLELYPNGFSPEIQTGIQDDALTFGVKGTVNDWNVDFSHTIGSNQLRFTVNNSNNASLELVSPRTFSAGGFQYGQSITNIDLSKTFYWLPNGFNVAFGGELRVENYKIDAGEEASYIDGDPNNENPIVRAVGAQVFPGIQPENELDRQRTNSAAYVDLEANFTENLLLRSAARYEVYNDFGGQAIWKFSGRYSITDDIAIRAGFSTGFRAPSLHQTYFQNISTQFVGDVSIRVGTFNNESAVAKEAFGIENLKPELSNNFSAGLSGKLTDNFSFSLDYYLINIKDRIVLSGRFTEEDGFNLEEFGVGAAQFFTNAVDSKTSGFDAFIAYKTALWNGEFNATLGANITDTKVVGDISVSEILQGKEQVLFNREEISRVEAAQPNFKTNLALSYNVNKFYFQLRNTWFGEVDYIHPSDGDPANWTINEFTGIAETRDQTFSPKLVTDLSISYQINSYINATVGGNNIFNVYPDEHTHSGNTSSGNFRYSRRVQQFGVNGANYYLRLLFRI